MKITINSQIEIETINKQIISEIKKTLTSKNPDYYKLLSIGKSVYQTPSNYKMYLEPSNSNKLIIPRGTGKLARQIANKYNERVTTLIDNRSKGRNIDCDLIFSADFKYLFTYQQEVIDHLIDNNLQNGTIVMPCGSGKTVTAVSLISTLKISTLILVDKIDLVNQWTKEIKDKLEGSFTMGQIGGGKKTLGDITVATIQSLYKYNDKQFTELSKHFGMVIQDECFHYNTLISTDKGLVKIGDICSSNKNYKILTYNFNKRELEYKNVLSKYKNKPKTKLLKVSIADSDGSIKTLIVTENHKFPDINGNYKEIKNYKINDELLSNEIKYCKILDIQEYNEPLDSVYNIEVQDNHNYFANGILTKNCHHTPSNSFLSVISKLSCKKVFGLSATPRRKDQKQFLLYNYIGPIVFEINDKKLEKLNKLTKVKVIYESTNLKIDFNKIGTDWPKLSKIISNDYDRNNLILQKLEKDILDNKIIMVLCHRIKLAKYLALKLHSLNHKVALLIGETDDIQRQRIIKNCRNGEYNVIVCTNNIAGEGLDLPIIDTVYLTFIINNESMLKQYIGRGRRVTEDKEYCLVRIFKDIIYTKSENNDYSEHFMSINIYNNQLRWFRNWGFDIQPAVNNTDYDLFNNK